MPADPLWEEDDVGTAADTSQQANARVPGFLRDYVARTREFSRNANLYVLHVIGMDMIHGSFNVLFNLYLLAIGFDVRFVGLRLMIGFIASAVTATAAGMVSDRIGRKASFILGDGVGAALGLIQINTTSEWVLLAGPAGGAFFGNLHHTSESAFMMENSQPRERVHLFSVASSFRTLSAMAGALIAGLVPALFIDDIGRVSAYRYATYAGLALWFLSLIPALMLREVRIKGPLGKASSKSRRGFHPRAMFSGISHPGRIAFFVLTTALIYFGTSAIVPLMNVTFHEGHAHAGESEIGVIFAIGEGALALAILAVPFLAMRMLKVDAIAVTRLIALPFVLGIGLVPLIFPEGSVLILLMAASYVGRVAIFRMGFPLDEAFNMEVLDPKERATATGLEIALGAALSAPAIVLSSRLMDSGDFTTPFVIAAAAYLASTAIYWIAFRRLEMRVGRERTAQVLAQPVPAAAPAPASGT
ncbi:MAG: MFS transporter [Chloroflexi bacterium]|nr:MFS transporter [Chloroflexota bacterium]